MRRSVPASFLTLVVAFVMAAPATAAEVTSAGTLRLQRLTGTLTAPLAVVGDPVDPERVFVVEQGGGIRLAVGGAVRPDPFLTVPNVNNNGEQGLLGLALAPDYATSGLFYTYSNNTTDCSPSDVTVCAIHIDEWKRAAGDPDHADVTSRRLVLRIDHLTFQNHDGGTLQFGPDGYLYAAVGDGGGGGDSLHSGQNRGVLLGKLLRINPADPSPGTTGVEYTSPPDNPYVGDTSGPKPEIWSYGLRNPFRFSFDHDTGDLVIGDVGQSNREEIDWAPRSAGGGRGLNFGWNAFEGFSPYAGGDPLVGTHTPPVFDYGHSPSTSARTGCSITGGVVVRDGAVPELYGRYLFADYCRGILRTVVLDSPLATQDLLAGDEIAPLQVDGPVGFGEDAACRVYVAAINSGRVFRVLSASPGSGGGCVAPPGGQPPVEPPVVQPPVGQPPVGTPPVGQPPVGQPQVGTPPVATELRFAAAKLRSARVRRGRAIVVSVVLAGRATVTARLERAATGRRRGKNCVAGAAAPGSACRRWVSVEIVRRTLPAGGLITLPGRLRRHALVAGLYRVRLVAREGALTSSERRLALRVVP